MSVETPTFSHLLCAADSSRYLHNRIFMRYKNGCLTHWYSTTALGRVRIRTALAIAGTDIALTGKHTGSLIG